MINEYLMYYKEAAVPYNILPQDGSYRALPEQPSGSGRNPNWFTDRLTNLYRRRHPEQLDQPDQNPNYVKGLYRNALDKEMARTKRARPFGTAGSAIQGFGQGAVESVRPLADYFYNNPRKAINSLRPTRRPVTQPQLQSLPVQPLPAQPQPTRPQLIKGKPGGGWV